MGTTEGTQMKFEYVLRKVQLMYTQEQYTADRVPEGDRKAMYTESQKELRSLWDVLQKPMYQTVVKAKDIIQRKADVLHRKWIRSSGKEGIVCEHAYIKIQEVLDWIKFVQKHKYKAKDFLDLPKLKLKL